MRVASRWKYARGRVQFMKRFVQLLLIVGLAPLPLGCASTHFAQKWNSRTGSYRVSQAMHELGPPEKAWLCADGTQVGEWETRGGSTLRAYGEPLPSITGRGLGMGELMDNPYIPAEYLRLMFDQHGVLVTWDQKYR